MPYCIGMRPVIGLFALALALIAPLSDVHAQKWPDRPVKIILPYAPGGATDTIGRPWAEMLSRAFGQQFVIENRGGASGMIGVEATVKSAPDGYTFLLTPNSAITIVPSLRKASYDATKDLAPVARVGDIIGGFVIHPSVGVKTMQELIAYAKKNPGKLSFGSAGLGTSTHLRLEMLNLRAGINILHVPYRGSADALSDLLPGNVQLMNEIIVLPHVKSGKLILLAINHSQRHPDFPDVPTLTEAGIKNADVPIWFALWAPAGTPKDIIDRLNAKVVEIAKTDDMKAKMRAISVSVPLQTPEELGRHLRADIKLNLEVINAAHIKIE
ncbi:MAG: Bug family tripartite tricarboxylate transporter substrate binding protein [Hyphomicrobiaceae bacterium]